MHYWSHQLEIRVCMRMQWLMQMNGSDMCISWFVFVWSNIDDACYHCVHVYNNISAWAVYLDAPYVWLSSIQVAILAIILHLQLFKCGLIHRSTTSLKGDVVDIYFGD